MAPSGESIASNTRTKNLPRPTKLPIDNLHRTMSDISFELSKEEVHNMIDNNNKLPPISEVDDAKCECCGMMEECTPQYIEQIRKKYAGKWICGLCSEAVKEEVEKNGGNREEALNTHVNACARFNKFDRANPVLYQAEAMKEMLKRSARGVRGKSVSPKDKSRQKKVGIARSSSCISAITREVNDLTISS